MAKQIWKPTTMLNPVPVVMVSCQGKEGLPNIITVAWVGTINSEPPMVSISIRKERHSHKLIKESKQFVINLPSRKLTLATDLCGVKSGKELDKFKLAKLTPEKASKVNVPLIKECPVNLECVVKKVVELGTHDLFIAEIVAVNVEESILNEKGKLCMEKADLICYSHGEYWSLEKPLGYYGFSVNKKKTQRNTRNLPIKEMKKTAARAASATKSKGLSKKTENTKVSPKSSSGGTKKKTSKK